MTNTSSAPHSREGVRPLWGLTPGVRSLAMTMLAAPLTVACMHSAPPVAASLPAIATVGEVAGDATAGWLRDELAR